ncbi:acyl carrier protein [Paracoccus sanguinis]|uniref:acyl carrier protein n=1 Tax=Paracoccus sanguinis TaxID=1545044 RepID=UPI00051FA106|nr:acyl carrier protein [Paracoccus sanguinis]KGJ20302.1 hypothetical protein IX55_06700 [Paracoccus sanguinis]
MIRSEPLTEPELLAELSRLAGQEGIAADTPLFSTGLLDSVTMIQLIGYLEDRTGQNVGAADVTLENFDSAGRIMAYVGG